MKRLIADLICAASAVIAGVMIVRADSSISIGAASPSGVYYAVGDAICRAVASGTQKPNIGCAVVASSGSVSNVLPRPPEKDRRGSETTADFEGMKTGAT